MELVYQSRGGAYQNDHEKEVNMPYIISTSLVRKRYVEGKYQETGLHDADDFDAWLDSTGSTEFDDALYQIIEHCENQMSVHRQFAYPTDTRTSVFHAGWYRAYDEMLHYCRSLLSKDMQCHGGCDDSSMDA